ncbi:SRPBCC domain-containing protein [Streptomyces longispororuber]|uniref:SRPBCC domain-containing protein n=1 Tax=Streptomyces longispororuber TaxID=68230 RepID=UPI00210DB8E9|nr:SRPBCC domain-containing protein [Streptomyces longispororuber]MCQ4212724.1 SRPBCC domain-containing protein [Streptomyces longispororuber]
MEHEVFVPVPAESLRGVLCDPLRVARALPGFQRDASGDGGRLKVRIGGHAITYRGSVTVTEASDGSYAVNGEGTEARGAGGVKFALTARVAAADGGSALTFTGTASGDGRVAELPQDAVASAAHRLLNRFAENLGAAGQEPGSDPEGEEGEEDEAAEATGAADVPDAEVDDVVDVASLSVYETDVPPSSLDAAYDEESDEDLPAEPAAAHARRTMIGRSAEEVDHAPPRGRYAPVPAPDGVTASATLRWAAPAAALALASAIVVGRALRRRR